MQISFHIHSSLLAYVQMLVKRYDGRFINNPLMLFGGDSQVRVEFSDVFKANKFNRMLSIIQQPYF